MTRIKARREFLSDVGRGALLASVGLEIAMELGLTSARAEELGDSPARLTFGDLEPLVGFMQNTPPEALLSGLAEKMRGGTDLRTLVAAAALANARTFGGEDYVGFHTMMALAPSWHMSRQLSGARQALPVLKVLYRNTNRIQESGGRSREVLHPIEPAGHGAESGTIRDAVHREDAEGGEQILAALAQASAEDAFNHLLHAVQESPEVHRVVLPYRAWDLLGIVGREHALTLLRQSVRYCVRNEKWAAQSPRNQPRTLLPDLLEKHGLLSREPGDKIPEDAWVEELSTTFFRAAPAEAAEAAAAALAEGYAPDTIGEAISLAANQLVLRDHGRPPQQEVPGKPVGSVHGDSIGVHASDSANAWRNLARVSNARNTFASLILGAWQVAKDRTDRGGNFLEWEPLPVTWQLEGVKDSDPDALLGQLDEAVRGNLQSRAAAITAKWAQIGLPERPVFDLLLRYAISEDGALHAEKYYQTVREEFASTRPAFRWRHALGLARVTASEFGRPAAGVAEARELLGIG